VARKPPKTIAQWNALESRVAELEAALAAEPDKAAQAYYRDTVMVVIKVLGVDDPADAGKPETVNATARALAVYDEMDRVKEALELLDAGGEPEDVKRALAVDAEVVDFAEALAIEGGLGRIADRLRTLGIGHGEREPAELAGLIVRMLG
jgi:hypothetical protein